MGRKNKSSKRRKPKGSKKKKGGSLLRTTTNRIIGFNTTLFPMLNKSLTESLNKSLTDSLNTSVNEFANNGTINVNQLSSIVEHLRDTILNKYTFNYTKKAISEFFLSLNDTTIIDDNSLNHMKDMNSENITSLLNENISTVQEFYNYIRHNRSTLFPTVSPSSSNNNHDESFRNTFNNLTLAAVIFTICALFMFIVFIFKKEYRNLFSNIVNNLNTCIQYFGNLLVTCYSATQTHQVITENDMNSNEMNQTFEEVTV